MESSVLMRALAGVAALAACFGPSYREGLPCAENRACPPGQACGADGICRADPAAPGDGGAADVPTGVADGAIVDAAATDAPGNSADAAMGTGPVRVTTLAGNSFDPALVWTGTVFGLTWGDTVAGAMEIFAVRLDGGGAMLGAAVQLSNDPAFSALPAIAWTGSEFGVAWHDTRDGNNEIYMGRLTTSGSVAATDVRVTTAAGDSEQVAITYGGGDYRLAWSDDRVTPLHVYFGRASETGTLLGPETVVSDGVGPAQRVAAAQAGGDTALVWMDQRGGNFEIFFARIAPDGSVAAGPAQISNNGAYSAFPAIATAGAEFGVAWQDNRDTSDEIYFARVNAAGAKLTPETRVTNAAGFSGFPAIAWSGAEFGVAWQDERDGSREIYLRRLAPDGGAVAPELRVTDAGDSEQPSIVWTGVDYALAWQDDRDGNYEIYFQRVVP
jgi:hypothetical protein